MPSDEHLLAALPIVLAMPGVRRAELVARRVEVVVDATIGIGLR